MTTVQIDKELTTRLTKARDPIVLCDETGHRIGLFLPDEKDEELYRRAREAFSDEELDRASREPGGFTLAEILADLERQWPST